MWREKNPSRQNNQSCWHLGDPCCFLVTPNGCRCVCSHMKQVRVVNKHSCVFTEIDGVSGLSFCSATRPEQPQRHQNPGSWLLADFERGKGLSMSGFAKLNYQQALGLGYNHEPDTHNRFRREKRIFQKYINGQFTLVILLKKLKTSLKPLLFER